jgi:site-specific recombinase XerD
LTRRSEAASSIASRACASFFAWCEARSIADLVEVEPFHVSAYLKTIGATHEKPTVKQHLAAVRMLFDWLVVGQVIALNPAHSVRGPKHVVKRGKTPVLTPAEARKLLDLAMRRPVCAATSRRGPLRKSGYTGGIDPRSG